MAATVTVTRPDIYPAGTKVKVFLLPTPSVGEVLRDNSGSPASWKPALTELGEFTVGTAGELVLTGLEPGQAYLLWAEVEAGSARYTNAGLTAESAKLTSATGSFTSSMVRAPVEGVGIPAGTQVLEYVSTTEVLLTKAATLTLTNATVTIGQPDHYFTVRCPLQAKDQSLVSGSPKTIKVKTTSTQIVAANASREGLQIVNTGANAMYLQLGAAAKAEEGIYLAANGGSWDGLVGPVVWTGSVFGIAITAEAAATVAEI